MKTMRALKNEKGIALITTLMLLVLGCAVVVTLMKLVTNETKLTRLEQNYATALDTAKGGADLFMYMRQNGLPTQGLSNPPNAAFGASANAGNCLQVKMNNPTTCPTCVAPIPTSWSMNALWAGCGTQADATDPHPDVQPDTTLTMSNYTVKIKVIDTVFTQPTNPALCPPLPATCPCLAGCYYYTVNVHSQATGSPEKSDITFVYQWDPQQ